MDNAEKLRLTASGFEFFESVVNKAQTMDEDQWVRETHKWIESMPQTKLAELRWFFSRVHPAAEMLLTAITAMLVHNALLAKGNN